VKQDRVQGHEFLLVFSAAQANFSPSTSEIQGSCRRETGLAVRTNNPGLDKETQTFPTVSPGIDKVPSTVQLKPTKPER
jgi:hypothetical protein